MPVRDPLLAQLPAQEDRPALVEAVEVDEALLEALEQAADLLELLDVAVDLLRAAVDLDAQLLEPLLHCRFERRARELLEAAQLFLERGIQRDDVLDDATHQRQRPVRLLDGEVSIRVVHDGFGSSSQHRIGSVAGGERAGQDAGQRVHTTSIHTQAAAPRAWHSGCWTSGCWPV